MRNTQFAQKLESLLHRAYNLQEDFGSTIPPDSLLADLGMWSHTHTHRQNKQIEHSCLCFMILICFCIIVCVGYCCLCSIESEGTLILPNIENCSRLHDDDATTVASDDSFFSAAEVSSCTCCILSSLSSFHSFPSQVFMLICYSVDAEYVLGS